MFWELPENQFIRAHTYLTWVNRPWTGTVDGSLGQTAHLTALLHIKAYFKTITSLRLPKILHHGCIPVPDGARPHTEEDLRLKSCESRSKSPMKSAPDLNLLSHFWVMVFSLTAAGLINLSLLDKQGDLMEFGEKIWDSWQCLRIKK